MTSLRVGRGGEIFLPDEMRERYGMRPDTPVRALETRGGILLIPLTDEPMSEELRRELDDWQSLAAASWDMFPYQDADGL